MRRILFALIMLAGAAYGFGQGAPSKQVFQSIYNTFAQGFVHGDIAAIGRLVTSDYTTKGLNGKTASWPEIAQAFKAERASMSSVSWHRVVRKVTGSASQATVVVDGDMKAVQASPNGKRHPFRFLTTSVDIWVKTPKGWRLKSAKLAHSSLTMDGKKVKTQ